ncbi:MULTISPECIES: hypothetical protein [Pseudomonas]|uniref:hypothetical protein n=1 Tax=Pseudomonas TaxID=286 RepID=UPI001586AE28|nr:MULTISPECIES: hypothetical protein [Pseudomonas]MCI0994526.1 hypothetical protein [Pseudomonas corrugata]NUT68019.1 hypothetical protein [Pseudomonas corrugata]
MARASIQLGAGHTDDRTDGALVFTASNLNQHFAGAVKPGEERYELWRLPLKGEQSSAK